jgi:hypothetical protein
MKNVGKPYAGKLHVRFDEEGLGPQPLTLLCGAIQSFQPNICTVQ